MFTGLVETTARIARLDRKGREATVRFDVKLTDLMVGESICCSGACLTVTRFDDTGFEVDASIETLEVSTLGRSARGRRVNIERACRAGDRLGGHLVLGHVDGIGRVRSLEPIRAATRWVIEGPADLAMHWAAKGSVAVDGVSLTINRVVAPHAFELMLIPHTDSVTTLGERRVGDAVNLEVDVLSRYVARQLQHAGITPSPSGASLVDALRRGGFMDGDGGVSH